MKLLIATGLFPPEVGGPATYSKTLLDELPKGGIQVGVLPYSEVRRLPWGLRQAVYISKVLNRGRKADIIFAQDPLSVGFPALIANIVLKKKFVVRIAGDYAWEQGVQRSGVSDSLDDFSRSSEYPFFVRLLKKIQLHTAQSASKIIVPSLYLKKIISNWGVHPAKIEVVYNSFQPIDVHESQSALRKKLELDGTILLSAGRLVPWKGNMTLIEMMPEILKEKKDARLLIAGDGPERQKLEKRVAELELTKQVVFLGQLPKEKLFEFYKASDVYVLNTAYEGFSHQLLEVMSVGTPIVTTRVGGNREIIEDGVSGTLVEYNDTTGLMRGILNVLEDKEFVKRTTKKAQEKAETFSLEKMITATKKVLENVR